MINFKEQENFTAKQQLEKIHKITSSYEPRILPEDINREITIHEKGLEIICSSELSQEKQKKTEQLLKERIEYIRHTPTGGLKGTCVFFNMKQIGLPPTPPNPLFDRLCVPGISIYTGVASNIATVLLDLQAMKYVPQAVLNKLGDLSGKQVELFLTTADGKCGQFRTNQEGNIYFNLHTHRWAYPSLLPGDDAKCDVNMGIFPEVGIQKFQKNGAVAIDGISPMQVHVHPDHVIYEKPNQSQASSKYSSQDMLDSPNNAHFQIIAGSPFGVMWTVAQKDNRIAITKMVVIIDREHPICKAYVESIRDCYCLKTHLARLENVKDRIQETFASAIELFEKNDPKAMAAFNNLPLAFQYGIFKETWKEFQSPTGIHGDFGKASFTCENSLNAKYHCDSNRRAKILGQYMNELQNLLVNSQNDLMLNSQALIKGDNVLKLMQCAQEFLQKKTEKAILAFNQFSKGEKQAVYRAIWELSGCPRGDKDFGENTFTNPNTNLQLKAEALILAASRLTPNGYNKKLSSENNNNNNDNQIQILDVEPFNSVEDNNVIIPASPSLAQTTINQAISLVSEEEFNKLNNTERAKKVNALLKGVDIETRNKIYGSVYHHSSIHPKGGDNWGMHHVADDLEALFNALMDVLES